jgi:hypothetical protein
MRIGLDGVWGEANIFFPWSVYEAKKKPASYEDSEAHIYEANLLLMVIIGVSM